MCWTPKFECKDRAIPSHTDCAFTFLGRVQRCSPAGCMDAPIVKIDQALCESCHDRRDWMQLPMPWKHDGFVAAGDPKHMWYRISYLRLISWEHDLEPRTPEKETWRRILFVDGPKPKVPKAPPGGQVVDTLGNNPWKMSDYEK